MTFHDRRPPTRRPRRANTLKDLPRLLGIAEPAHEESRRDRLLAKARRMSDTLPNARRNYFNIQVACARSVSPSSRMIGCFTSGRIGLAQSGLRGSMKASESLQARAAADVAPVIADLQAAGKTSLRAIADGLNERGIPTARGNGEWSAVQVQRVLARL